MAKLSLSHRSFAVKLIMLGGFVTIMLSLYTLHPSSSRLRDSVTRVFTKPSSSTSGQCPPQLWSSGQWTRRDPPRSYKTSATTVQDVLEMAGFEWCASDRDFRWHIAAEDDQLHRYPDLAAYQWTPPEDCNYRRFDREAVVRDMVEQGGWLLIGDSVTEGHFFSLSCMLFPHVIATPNHTLNPYWDRAWPQNLYLNPDSPLVEYLRPPAGFNITQTPLVTFRRVDLLLSQDQLRDVYSDLHPHEARKANFELFGGDAVWEMQPSEYLSMFTAPLPQANYATMVVSTAGHWTVGTFPGLKDESMPGEGIGNVMEFFGEAMQVWSGMVQGWLKGADGSGEVASGGGSRTKGGRRRQVVIRAYIPGHDGCHNPGRRPWTWYEQGNMKLPYNWGQIPGMNNIFEDVLTDRRYKDIHFLPIDMPALLRPDAHVGSDCLHLMAGSGVLEGWSEYIWHYVTREILPQ